MALTIWTMGHSVRPVDEFLAAAAALQVRGHTTVALTFAALAVVSSLLLYALPQ